MKCEYEIRECVHVRLILAAAAILHLLTALIAAEVIYLAFAGVVGFLILTITHIKSIYEELEKLRSEMRGRDTSER